MTGFRKPGPGDPPTLLYNSAYHGAIIDVLADKAGFTQKEEARLPPKRETGVFSVRNSSGEDCPLGGVLGISGVEISADTHEGWFATQEPTLVGTLPTNSDRLKYVVAISPIPAGEIREAVAAGWVQAKVNITDTLHDTAMVAAGKTMLQSAGGSGAPMLQAEAGTGEKWCLIYIAEGGTNVGLAKVSEISAGLTEGASLASWATTGKAWLYNSWGLNSQQHVTNSRCEVSATDISTISGEHDENQLYSTGDQVTHNGDVYKARHPINGASFSLSDWDWVEPYRPAYDETEAYTEGDKVTVGGIEYTASSDSADPAGSWDEDDWQISSDPRISVHSIHKGIELTADTWVTVYGTSPVVCGGGPYFASYANPDDYLRMMDGWTESQMQALYHSAGDDALRWGGSQCEE